MNKAGIVLLLLIIMAGCTASKNGRTDAKMFEGQNQGSFPVLRIVYSANTYGQFKPEAG